MKINEFSNMFFTSVRSKLVNNNKNNLSALKCTTLTQPGIQFFCLSDIQILLRLLNKVIIKYIFTPFFIINDMGILERSVLNMMHIYYTTDKLNLN